MHRRSMWLLVVCLVSVAGCGTSAEEEDAELLEELADSENIEVIEEIADNTAPKVETSTPNYEEKDGDFYRYVAAVSEEEGKAGKSAGDVVTFRYLGQSNGLYRLALMGDDGRQLAVSECPRQCKIIKTTRQDGSVRRVGFDTGSIIGGAFEDAFNGHLTASNPKRVQDPSSLPVVSSPEQAVPGVGGSYDRNEAATEPTSQPSGI